MAHEEGRVRGRGFDCSATGSKFTVHDTVKFGTVMFYKDYIGNASAGYVISVFIIWFGFVLHYTSCLIPLYIRRVLDIETGSS